MISEEILSECRDVIEEVCQKYGYDAQDNEGNDSLKTVLLKAIPAMLKDSNREDRELFYQMLRHTPIVVTENLTQESYDALLDQYIGKDINEHIVEEDVDHGEYGKTIGNGAYVSEPIFDENMNLKGKKSFLYIQRVEGQAKEFYGTDINVSHLIHELGHAWNAEKDEYTMQEDGTLKHRVGTIETIYSFSKGEDGKYIRKHEKTTGIMIEESINTIAEEDAMAIYMGIPLEEMQRKYRDPLVPNNYQGYMSDFFRHVFKQLGKDDFVTYRLYGDLAAKERINSIMARTEYWKNRETDILPSSSDSPRNYDNKRAIINKIDNEGVQEFFRKYEHIYFPDVSNMTPLEKIDNVLEQKFSMNMTRHNMGIDNYGDFLDILGYEGYSLVNQAADLINSNEQGVITPSQAAKSALNGTTIDKTQEAAHVEISEINLDNNREGETRDDQ